MPDTLLPRAVLIANRGEIAVRIARTCRELGVHSIAVYSDADRGALHVREADAAISIGPAPAAQSYLNIPALLDAAARSGADAVHPGYGFLSENADFARACASAGLVWIGPPADVMSQLGDKPQARQLAVAAGVPVADGIEQDEGDEALAAAIAQLGYPVMLKAAAGGGGRGMRLLTEAPDDLVETIASARREAESAFGDGRLLVERAIVDGRHVEVQVLADRFGNAVHLGERDCSVQRRRQKVIEEAPAPGVDDDLRHRLGEAALAIIGAAGYQNAGTVEFLLLPNDEFVFLEVNTRLQVEHPVTEAVTGLDLVELQLRIAMGEELPISQTEIHWQGHAIESRVYAEDPTRDYLPSTGRLAWFAPSSAAGVRNDLGVAAGSAVTPHYDPLLGKVIAHGADRKEALARSVAALEGTAIAGLRTNVRQLVGVLGSDDFRSGGVDVGWLERTELGPRDTPTAALIAAALDAALPRIEGATGGWRSSGDTTARLALHGSEHTVTLQRVVGANATWEASVDGDANTTVNAHRTADGLELSIDRSRQSWSTQRSRWGVIVGDGDRSWAFTTAERDRSAGTRRRSGGSNAVHAPMPGTIAAVLVAEGDLVEAGQTLVVLEAMKMEHLLPALAGGRVASVRCEAGATVEEGQLLVEVVAVET